MNPRLALAAATLLALAAPAATTLVAADCCATESEPKPATTAATAVSASASDTPAADAAPAARGHPLRGVVVAVLAEKSALLVDHEEIPGVMAAMTMLLKVDAATLAAAKKDQRITATLVKKADGWWLENLAPVASAPAS